jgi:hypothetical protein
MNKDGILWHTVPRDIVPEVLLGGRHAFRFGRPSFDSFDLAGLGVAVGYAESRSDSEYNPPCLLVLGEKAAAETFSWLKVYAKETSPLSQYARVISGDDWSRFGNSGLFKRESREDVWASVLLGEVLAQGEAEIDMASLPLSRAGACFSMAIARATCTHGTDDAMRICIDRLRKIEADRRFVRRAVTVNDLLPVWTMAGSHLGNSVSGEAAVGLVLNTAQSFIPDAGTLVFDQSPISLLDNSGFASDSIEERVLAFQNLLTDLTNARTHGGRNAFSDVFLAAAAFLVGRSTSHEFLLRRVSKLFPTASVWYGLIAALAGPAVWDANWARATKSIEKQIQSKFDWSDSAGFDLCWLEYQWMTSTFESPEVFTSFPKLMPRVLAIEVIPGAACQFRLTAGAAPEPGARPLESNQYEKDLQSTLSQFVELAYQAQNLLKVTAPSQKSLELQSVQTPNRRPSRAKKVKSTSEKRGISD